MIHKFQQCEYECWGCCLEKSSEINIIADENGIYAVDINGTNYQH